MCIVTPRLLNSKKSSWTHLKMNQAVEPIGSLEEEALKRRERLNNLKRKKVEAEELPVSDLTTESEPQRKLPKPTFRSYTPGDESLKALVLPAAQPGNVESEVKDQLASGKDKVVIEELDITNLAPRKPDWDLKRDVKKKLEKLERRTQKAIAELIRERLKIGQSQHPAQKS